MKEYRWLKPQLKHSERSLIAAETSKSICHAQRFIRPFYERDQTGRLRFHLAALFHLLRGERLPPPRRFFLGKVAEWAFWRSELLQAKNARMINQNLYRVRNMSQVSPGLGARV